MMTVRGRPVTWGKSLSDGFREMERRRKYQGPSQIAAQSQASTALDSPGRRSEEGDQLLLEPLDLTLEVGRLEFVPRRGDPVMGEQPRHQGVGVSRDRHRDQIGRAHV